MIGSVNLRLYGTPTSIHIKKSTTFGESIAITPQVESLNGALFR